MQGDDRPDHNQRSGHGYICPDCGEGLPEDTPCPCTMAGGDFIDHDDPAVIRGPLTAEIASIRSPVRQFLGEWFTSGLRDLQRRYREAAPSLAVPGVDRARMHSWPCLAIRALCSRLGYERGEGLHADLFPRGRHAEALRQRQRRQAGSHGRGLLDMADPRQAAGHVAVQRVADRVLVALFLVG